MSGSRRRIEPTLGLVKQLQDTPPTDKPEEPEGEAPNRRTTPDRSFELSQKHEGGPQREKGFWLERTGNRGLAPRHILTLAAALCSTTASVLFIYYYPFPIPAPLSLPITAPPPAPEALPPPVPGQQDWVKLSDRIPCVASLEGALTGWAQQVGFSARVAFRSDVALDMEFLPDSTTDLNAMPQIDEDAFESQCYLYERYPDKVASLRSYLRGIHYLANDIDASQLTSLGFTREDVKHLARHLTMFTMFSYKLTQLSHGIRYFRVTYATRPRPGIYFNVGTLTEGYLLTPAQERALANLRRVALEAAECRVRFGAAQQHATPDGPASAASPLRQGRR